MSKKIINCKVCEAEIAANAKTCPHCGAKNKKPIFKKWWFWTIVIVVLISACSSGDAQEETTSDVSNDSAISSAEESTDTSLPNEEIEPVEEETEVVEETPEILLSTDVEKEIWEIVKNNDGKLDSIETIASEESDEATIIAAILCENNENTVNTILSEVSASITSNDTKEGVIFTFGDIEDGEDADMLVMAGVYSDGTIDVSYTSPDYNSARNQWIQSQFSVWDGAHTEMENLIIRNLNDEKSYDHIETTYSDITDESIRDEINQILSDAGYSQRVEVGDLFIQTVFSAKNAFGGTIKNTAYGISSYNNNTITLIAIE